jgi:hypothetical protein
MTAIMGMHFIEIVKKGYKTWNSYLMMEYTNNKK